VRAEPQFVALSQNLDLQTLGRGSVLHLQGCRLSHNQGVKLSLA
jgi:hypothetical protein